jgi:nucleotide-binding universal stress UspA family protein
MKILLALDRSNYSRAALAGLIAQISPLGNEVRVLHVADVIEAYFAEGMTRMLIRQAAAIRKQQRELGKVLLKEAVQTLRRAGFRANAQLASGEPKEQILRCAEAWHADLILLGSHGRTGYSRLLLGSVSEAVMRHARCSVEIFRSGIPSQRTRGRNRAN